jgi:hypothetical protein
MLWIAGPLDAADALDSSRWSMPVKAGSVALSAPEPILFIGCDSIILPIVQELLIKEI